MIDVEITTASMTAAVAKKRNFGISKKARNICWKI